jgi:iron complex outermembrane receptor protein
MSSMYPRALACVALLGAPAVHAEQPPIVISAGRTAAYSIDTPAAIAVVERQQITDSGAASLAELLRGRGGLYVSDAYGDGSSAVVDMRGFGPTASSNTLILVDGRRLNNSSDIAAPDLASIDLANVERVEILQGSAGTLFGNQAVGGVINVITRSPARGEAELEGGAGSYDGYTLRGRLADRLESGLSYRLSAHKRESDNYRDNNDLDREQLSLRLDYGHGAGHLFFEQELVRDTLRLPGSLFAEEIAIDRRQSAPAYAGDFSDSETAVSRLGARQTLGDDWSLEAELTYRDNDRRFQTGFRSFPGSPATQQREVWGFTPRLIGSLGAGGRTLKLTLGADLEHTDYALRTAFGPQTQEQETRAVYAQFSADLAPGWSATAGLRHARWDSAIHNNGLPSTMDDRITVGSAGLVYRPAPGWRLFARWDQNYRFAKVDELTNVVTGQPADLSNQSGDSYELGGQLDHGAWRAKLLAYRLDLNDEISFDSSSYFNVNLDATRRQGGLLELDWSPSPHWRLGGSYTFVDSEITAGPFRGKDLPLVPRHNGRLYLEFLAAAGWSLNAEALLAGERVLGGDFANSFEKLTSYAVINLAASYDWGAWQFTARVNNLWDERYSETGAVGFDQSFALRDAYFPSPERNVWISAGYRFSP